MRLHGLIGTRYETSENKKFKSSMCGAPRDTRPPPLSSPLDPSEPLVTSGPRTALSQLPPLRTHLGAPSGSPGTSQAPCPCSTHATRWCAREVEMPNNHKISLLTLTVDSTITIINYGARFYEFDLLGHALSMLAVFMQPALQCCASGPICASISARHAVQPSPA